MINDHELGIIEKFLEDPEDKEVLKTVEKRKHLSEFRDELLLQARLLDALETTQLNELKEFLRS